MAPAPLPPPPGRRLHGRPRRPGLERTVAALPIKGRRRRWKRWVYFYIPMTIFVIGTLFPFYWMLITSIRPDAELYRSWRAVNNTPFWTTHPTLEHFRDLMAKTTFPTWLWNTFFIACVSTAISLFCGLLAGYALGAAQVPAGGHARHQHLRHLPGAADPALHPARQHHPHVPARRHPVGPDPHLPDLPDPVLHLAPDGLLQDHSQGARGVRADRRGHPLRGHGAHHLPDRGARASCPRASSRSPCPGTSSSTRWSSCRRPRRRRSRWAWSPS